MEIFSHPPRIAAWLLQGAHDGFEVTHIANDSKGITLKGTSVGVEEGVPWSFQYAILLDPDWRTRSARITAVDGKTVTIKRQGTDSWLVDGTHESSLDGCFDIDLEGSATTNALPVHRMSLKVNELAKAPAVYIRTNSMKVERLEQTYRRLPDENDEVRFYYTSPDFGYQDTLRFARDGFVVDYPGIAKRHLRLKV